MQPLTPGIKKKKKFKFGWILILVFILRVWYYWLFASSRNYAHTVIIEKWDTFATFLKPLSSLDLLRFKLFVKAKWLDMSKIEEGTYVFSGEYTPAEYLAVINEWVEADYQSFTVLEGWSIYDIDQSLSNKGLIEKEDYLDYVRSAWVIQELSQKYSFLKEFGGGELETLEGFLYPDTYFLDKSQGLVKQLVALQLENFNKKIWAQYADIFASHKDRLDSAGYTSVDLSNYELLVLSTVVEKEERNNVNKPTIAGLFYNRLKRGERIDADITLCYGLEEGYETCTPEIIVKHLYDAGNIYNTRALHWLPPTPIANPTDASVKAVLEFKKTDYIFYLHDPMGNIHFAKTISEHNANKSKYLN